MLIRHQERGIAQLGDEMRFMFREYETGRYIQIPAEDRVIRVEGEDRTIRVDGPRSPDLSEGGPLLICTRLQ